MYLIRCIRRGFLVKLFASFVIGGLFVFAFFSTTAPDPKEPMDIGNNLQAYEVYAKREEGVAADVPQPPVCFLDNLSYHPNTSYKNTHMITAFNEGRLGNQMFAYASMLGVAERNFFLPALPDDSPLRQVFNITAKAVNGVRTLSWRTFTERKAYTYDTRTGYLNYELDIRLVGYFLSWRYFDHAKTAVKRELTFLSHIRQYSEQFLAAVRTTYGHGDPKKLTIVGIHWRRGDLVLPSNHLQGYTVAPLEYIHAAMMYFVSVYTPSRLVFVVCSDDMDDVREDLQSLDITSAVPTVFAHRETFSLELSNQPEVPFIDTPEVHLCVLSLCNHVIITTGSFSWWAGWLSPGKVIYYEDFPLPFSPLESQFRASDYFPDSWIGIS